MPLEKYLKDSANGIKNITVCNIGITFPDFVKVKSVKIFSERRQIQKVCNIPRP